MRPPFQPADVPALVERYWRLVGDAHRRMENDIIEKHAPVFRKRGHLTKDDLLLLVRWKSPRTIPGVERNSCPLVREVTEASLSEKCSEELRIKILTLLDGVEWPVASVVLHFAFADWYPILDFRAIGSLQVPLPRAYTFQFWMQYTQFCRNYIREHGLSVRDFDRALWAHSKESQRR